MPYLVTTAQQFRESEISRSIADDYIHNYLEKLPDTTFFTKEKFTFIGLYPANLDSKERMFAWCLHEPVKVDTMVQDKGFSARVVKYVVNKEEINPPLKEAQKTGVAPDWNKMSESIRQRFGASYVQENVLAARIRFYQSVKDWKNYTKYLVAKMDNDKVQENIPTGFWGFVGLNSSAWDVFQYSDDKEELDKALSWSNIVVNKMEPKAGPNYGTFMDTKANLLYKLGRKEEALELEAKAIVLTPNDKGVQEAYHKMKEGKPTW
jgi:tetratricopeptide (TPR) repeat protein